MRNDNRNIIGYCLYCKRPIYESEDYSVRNGEKYHPECYDLIDDAYGMDLEDYTETEYKD